MDRVFRKRDDEAALTFAPISLFSPGTLADLLHKSYQGLVEKWPGRWDKEAGNWDDFDRQAFAHPETVGRCVFVSRLGDESVGLASYDPRQAPRYGIIGQNCVVPEYRGRGFGRQHILEILRRFREREIRTARVTTSEHPFFCHALRMYQSLGFKETRRFPGGPDPHYALIELDIELVPLDKR
jgi:ribosomal protein S18 acetylase RimI-like enzyme